jgi:O-antigen ligase
LAAFLAVAGLVLAWVITHKKTGKYTLPMAGLFYAGLLTTLSRSIWYGLLPGAWLALRGTSRRIQVLVLIMIAIGLAWTSYARWDPPRPEKVTPYTSASSRLVYWSHALRACLEHPFFGVGLKNYHFSFLAARGQKALKDLKVVEAKPHGLFFGLAAETGIVGLAIFGLIYLWPLIRLLVRRNSSDFLVLGLMVCLLLHASIHNYLYQYLLWSGLGLSVGKAFSQDGGEW